MKILVIDEWLPYPLETGKKIRSFNLLAPLAKQHEINYLCYANERVEKEKIEILKSRGFKIICIPPVKRFDTPLRLAAGAALNIFTSTPLVIRKHYSLAYQNRLVRLLSEKPFDLIHCEWTHYGNFLFKLRNLPLFLSSHNVECVPWLRFYKAERNPLKKAGLFLEWIKIRYFERRVLTLFDHISAVSYSDARILENWFDARSVDVVPNGVDTKYYGSIICQDDSRMLVFSASMDSFVNQDAASYFVHEILPIIKTKIPEIKFMILGKNPSNRIRKLEDDHITVTGTVSDIRQYLKKAGAIVVPLRIAGGSRLKILEAFAAGIPVVSTTIGAEGLEVIKNKHLLIGDNPRDFADRCIHLLGNALLRKNLVNEGKKLSKEKYDWSAISPKIERAWELTINNYNKRTVLN